MYYMVKPRNSLSGIKICEHGGKVETDNKNELIDFSVNLNPYGPPDFVFDVIKEAMEEINLYPDTECSELREKISKKFGCHEGEVLVGAGVSELIQLVALSFVKDRALMLKHTYGEYEVAAKMVGAKIRRMEMPALQINPESIVAGMKKNDVVFLCNPNNPTGQYLGKNEIEQIIAEADRVDSLIVIDEAYVDFVTNAFPSHDLISSTQNLIILRSLTKSYAIPGVRIGYAISSEENIREMRKIKAPWSVSTFAHKMGIALIGAEGDAFLVKTREKIERSKKRMEEAFRGAICSDANFYIFGIYDRKGSAREVKRELLKHGLLVRDCASFGLPAHIRFSVKKDEENELLIHFLLEKEPVLRKQ